MVRTGVSDSMTVCDTQLSYRLLQLRCTGTLLLCVVLPTPHTFPHTNVELGVST